MTGHGPGCLAEQPGFHGFFMRGGDAALIIPQSKHEGIHFIVIAGSIRIKLPDPALQSTFDCHIRPTKNLVVTHPFWRVPS